MTSRRKSMFACLTMATALNVCAAVPREGIVIDEGAIGHAKANEQSPGMVRYPKYLQVRALETTKDPQGPAMLLLEPIVLHHRKPKAAEAIPSLWVDASHLVMFDDMKPIASCWPFRKVYFRDGVVDVQIAFSADGTGVLRQSDGEASSVPIRVFESRGVIGIRDRRGEQMFVLLSDKSFSNLSLQNEPIESERRDCKSLPR